MHNPIFCISVSPYVAHELWNMEIPSYCKDRPYSIVAALPHDYSEALFCPWELFFSLAITSHTKVCSYLNVLCFTWFSFKFFLSIVSKPLHKQFDFCHSTVLSLYYQHWNEWSLTCTQLNMVEFAPDAYCDLCVSPLYLISHMLFLLWLFSFIVELVAVIRLIPSKTIDRCCIFITWKFLVDKIITKFFKSYTKIFFTQNLFYFYFYFEALR